MFFFFQVSRKGVHTHFRTRSNDSLEPHKQVAGSVPPVASVSSFQSREPPDVANVPSTTLAGVSVTVNLIFNTIYRLSP